MAVSTAQESELDLALDLLSKSKADVIYLVDSYGSLYPEQIRRYAGLNLVENSSGNHKGKTTISKYCC